MKEFIKVYGWLILIAILITGVIIFLKDYAWLLPSYCSFKDGLVCEDYAVSKTEGIIIVLRNAVGKPITIKRENIDLTINDKRKINWGNCKINGKEEDKVYPGKEVEIICKEYVGEEKERVKITGKVNYIKKSYPYPSTGKIITSVKP